ncbi:hypothetical protein GP486_002893 [Trichoglossum hirsutum]|uniref:Uracil-DNA glycosylase-like domain-containing protein n=1 Tax=Trichoglossum hirsutum TaxID=265104 RepID=A0A9P8LE67_9PEZI|nr:hypothetical protein GP486_002893 [Trichoglossum hirsutum]
MVQEKNPHAGLESPTKRPSFKGKLQRKLEDFSFSPTTPSGSAPTRRRSPRLGVTGSSSSVETWSPSRSPKRKADEISDGSPTSLIVKSPRSGLSALASPSSRKMAQKSKKRGSGYAPPETYRHLNLLPDTIVPNLICVFVGLNPGIKTAQMGHAYSHPSNHFWRLLHLSGLTPRRFDPTEDRTLPALCSLGNTNIVARPTRDQSELSKEEMDASVDTLVGKMRTFKPEAVCLVGKSIWESIFRTTHGRPMRKGEFKYGWQDESERMGPQGEYKGARVFVATTTSGLAAAMKPEEKLAVWKPLGDWVQQRRAERDLSELPSSAGVEDAETV